MSQVLVRPEKIVDGHFSLESKETHHVTNVLRKKTGDTITLFDGQGRRYIGELTGAGKGRIVKELDSAGKTCKLVLFQGLPKGSKFDFVIEKATELGVDRIVPFLSKKNIIKLDAVESKKKQARWSRVAEAAAKQCGRSDLPEIESAQPLESHGPALEQGLTLYFSLGEKSGSIKTILAGEKIESLGQINIVVGPESGFSDLEEHWLASIGATPVSLGALTLRTETAGLAALAILGHEINS